MSLKVFLALLLFASVARAQTIEIGSPCVGYTARDSSVASDACTGVQEVGGSSNSESDAIVVNDPLPAGVSQVTQIHTYHEGLPDGCSDANDAITIEIGAYSKSGNDLTLLRSVSLPSYSCTRNIELSHTLSTPLTVNAGEYIGYWNPNGDTELWDNSYGDRLDNNPATSVGVTYTDHTCSARRFLIIPPLPTTIPTNHPPPILIDMR